MRNSVRRDDPDAGSGQRDAHCYPSQLRRVHLRIERRGSLIPMILPLLQHSQYTILRIALCISISDFRKESDNFLGKYQIAFIGDLWYNSSHWLRTLLPKSYAISAPGNKEGN